MTDMTTNPLICDSLLDHESIDRFMMQSVARKVNRDLVLFRQGDSPKSVYLVRSGEVELTIPISAHRTYAFCAKAGLLIGLPAVVSNQPYTMTAMAKEGSESAEMSAAEFRKMIQTDPALFLSVLQILAAETRSARMAIWDAGSAPGGPLR